MPRSRVRKTMRGVIAANKAIGHHWFDEDAMGFFNTVIRSGLTICDEASYFYASHQYIDPRDASKDGPVIYTIQRARPDGRVDTIGKDVCDGGYPNGDAAQAAFYEARHAAILADREEATA